jgi:hypothetical protein
MPANLKVINTKDFIKTTVTGKFDFEASRQTLFKILSLIKQPDEYDVLVDTREAEALLSIIDLYELGKALASQTILRKSKICLLVPMKDIDMADFFETVAVNRGVQMKAFTDFEHAISWIVHREAS